MMNSTTETTFDEQTHKAVIRHKINMFSDSKYGSKGSTFDQLRQNSLINH